jgi:hypothetical protein
MQVNEHPSNFTHTSANYIQRKFIAIRCQKCAVYKRSNGSCSAPIVHLSDYSKLHKVWMYHHFFALCHESYGCYFAATVRETKRWCHIDMSARWQSVKLMIRALPSVQAHKNFIWDRTRFIQSNRICSLSDSESASRSSWVTVKARSYAHNKISYVKIGAYYWNNKIRVGYEYCILYMPIRFRIHYNTCVWFQKYNTYDTYARALN